MILEIERLWGEAPGWFEAQDEELQTRLFAWYRVHKEPAKKAKKPRKRGAGRKE